MKTVLAQLGTHQICFATFASYVVVLAAHKFYDFAKTNLVCTELCKCSVQADSCENHAENLDLH